MNAPEPTPIRKSTARAKLGHTETLTGVKLHPDIKAHVERRAAEEYCSTAEYVRRLIIADMRADR